MTTIETHEIWAFKTVASERPEVLCRVCQGTPAMLTPQEAARQAGVSQRTVFHWIDEAVVHFAETTEGLFVCLAPLTTRE